MYPDDYFDNCTPSELQGIDIDELINSVEIRDSINVQHKQE